MMIRPAQLHALRDAALAGFERRAAAHLNKFFPEQCAAAGDDGVLELIREGVERAASYGLRRERDVIRFLNHMYVLGRYFDVHPKYPWAQAILTDEHLAPAAKMSLLGARTRRELAEREATPGT